MNKRQIELLNFCGFEIKDNKIIDKNNPDSLITIHYEKITEFFSLEIQHKLFKANDYDIMEQFGIEFGRKLGLVHELNLIWGWKDNVHS